MQQFSDIEQLKESNNKLVNESLVRLNVSK